MPRVTYYGQEHEFRTDSLVHMKGPDVESPKMYVDGIGLVAAIDDEKWEIKRNVTVRRKLKTDEWMKVKAKSGKFFSDEQRAVFVDNVKTVLPEMKIDSDVFEMSLRSEGEFLHAKGNVRVGMKDKIGYAQSAYLEVGTSKMVLE